MACAQFDIVLTKTLFGHLVMVYLLKKFVFVCFTALIKGLCFKHVAFLEFFGFCRIETQSFYTRCDWLVVHSVGLWWSLLYFSIPLIFKKMTKWRADKESLNNKWINSTNKWHIPDNTCPFHLVNVCSFPWKTLLKTQWDAFPRYWTITQFSPLCN